MSEPTHNELESMANKPPVPPREDLVNTAATFLSSPNVHTSPIDMKIAFLKKKGLSDAEIELAIKRCDALLHRRSTTLEPVEYPVPYKRMEAPVHWTRNHRWITFRDAVNTLMLFAGIVYGVYWIYKKYIWNYLFGKRGKKITSDDRLSEIEANLSTVCRSIESFKESLDNKEILTREIHKVHSEVASVKKLLLSRKQFPTAATTPLSIPSWQISSATATADDNEQEGAATNGSDSSLEMIKE